MRRAPRRALSMTGRALHLLVPALRWPDARDPRAYDGLRLPTLAVLLGRGDRRPLEATSPEVWLAGQYGYRESPPFAALAALGARLAPGEEQWVCADPAHVRPQGAELFLSAGRHLAIDPAEATACVAALNTFFAEDGMQFRMLGPDRWIASTGDTDAFVAAPPSLAHGRSVDALLPTGPASRLWRKRLNESQMVLYPLALNDAREARGRQTINSAWFWGAGAFVPPTARPYVAIHADALEAHGLARATGATVGPSPTDVAQPLASARDGAVLCWLDDGIDAAAHGEPDAWRSALETLDATVFTVAVDALRRGEIDLLEIVAPAGRGGFAVTMTRRALRRFWRRIRPLDPPAA